MVISSGVTFHQFFPLLSMAGEFVIINLVLGAAYGIFLQQFKATGST